jgi:hypothetical protein
MMFTRCSPDSLNFMLQMQKREPMVVIYILYGLFGVVLPVLPSFVHHQLLLVILL